MTRHPLRRGGATPVVLDYIDAAGDTSTRTVLPLAILHGEGRRSDKNTYLQARCAVRKATRTFRFDRVRAISDPETGEVQAVDEWAMTVPLEDGAPFTWADEEDVLPIQHPEPAMAYRPRLDLRAGLTLALIGYAIGRLRVIPIILHIFGVHTGGWL